MVAKQALPFFIMEYMPPFFAGIALATLLLAVIGTGSGVALGFSTIITNDIYLKYINKKATGEQALRFNRILIVIVLLASALFTTGNLLSSAILQWTFLSMGLRGAVLLIPMTTAIFCPGRIPKHWAVASSVAGAAGSVIGKLVLKVPFDSLFVGLALSLIVILLGAAAGKNKRSNA